MPANSHFHRRGEGLQGRGEGTGPLQSLGGDVLVLRFRETAHMAGVRCDRPSSSRRASPAFPLCITTATYGRFCPLIASALIVLNLGSVPGSVYARAGRPRLQAMKAVSIWRSSP